MSPFKILITPLFTSRAEIRLPLAAFRRPFGPISSADQRQRFRSDFLCIFVFPPFQVNRNHDQELPRKSEKGQKSLGRRPWVP